MLSFNWSEWCISSNQFKPKCWGCAQAMCVKTVQAGGIETRFVMPISRMVNLNQKSEGSTCFCFCPYQHFSSTVFCVTFQMGWRWGGEWSADPQWLFSYHNQFLTPTSNTRLMCYTVKLQPLIICRGSQRILHFLWTTALIQWLCTVWSCSNTK